MNRLRPRDDGGSITPLIVGFALVLATLVGVAVDASASFLRRQQLDSIADAAALAATDGVRGETLYTDAQARSLSIDPVAAANYAQQSVDRSGARRHHPGLTLEVHTSGNRVVVVVREPFRVPIRVPGVHGSVITGRAASVVGVEP